MKFILVSRIFSREGVDPFEEEKWDKRTAEITDDKNRVVFRQADVLVPSFWSQLATNVVASKYFYGEQGTSERENSVRQLIHRMSHYRRLGCEGRIFQQRGWRRVLR